MDWRTYAHKFKLISTPKSPSERIENRRFPTALSILQDNGCKQAINEPFHLSRSLTLSFLSAVINLNRWWTWKLLGVCRIMATTGGARSRLSGAGTATTAYPSPSASTPPPGSLLQPIFFATATPTTVISTSPVTSTPTMSSRLPWSSSPAVAG